MWDWTNEYKRDLWLNNWWKKYILKPIINWSLYKLRQWDYIASKRPDISIANSINTKNRIKKYYKKDSIILYPPVETKRFSKEIWLTYKIPFEINNYYIIISALTEFKKIEVAINWFNKIKNNNLIIVWQWNYWEKLNSFIESNNIKLVWPKYWDELVYLVQNSKWLIFPWEEDFWIVPIEAMAAGKPIFAYQWWWLIETNIKWVTWDFFKDKDWNDFIENFKIFDENNKNWLYKKENCIQQAMLFDNYIFEKKLKEIIN